MPGKLAANTQCHTITITDSTFTEFNFPKFNWKETNAFYPAMDSMGWNEMPAEGMVLAVDNI